MHRFLLRSWSLLWVALVFCLLLQGAACAEDKVGKTCSTLGTTTMAADQQNLIACMKDKNGALVWKSMTDKGGSGVPVGGVIAWLVAGAPDDMQNADGTYNWLDCNGQGITSALYPELYKKIGGYVPDLRGLFLRGLDNGRGFDAGRQLGSYQADEVGPHTHIVNLWRHNAGGGGIWAYPKYDGSDGTITTRANAGIETRPKNYAVRFAI